MSLLPKCPPGFFYDEDARRYRPFTAVNINRGGVLLTSAEGWRQRMNPLEAMRRTGAGSDAGTVKAAKAPTRRSPTPFPEGRSQCQTEGCLNMTTIEHTTCTSCRRKSRAGQRRVYFAVAVAARSGR